MNQSLIRVDPFLFLHGLRIAPAITCFHPAEAECLARENPSTPARILWWQKVVSA
jgi:hypothetical protein